MSLGAKFLRIVPLATVTVVLLTIFSQVAILLAFFLPLKVVILLGSSGMPRYFPLAWQSLDRDLLILLLSGATVGFYVAYHLAEHLIRRVTDYGAQQLLSRSQKLVLFENQDEIASKAYLRYSRALSGAVFCTLAVCALAWLYPAMAPVVLSVIFLMILISWLLYSCNTAAERFLDENLSSAINVYAGLGFFLGFAYLVTDFLFWDPPGLISAIVALLLLRQIFRRSATLVTDLSALYSQHHRLDALFFHGKIFVPQEKLSKQQEIWSFLDIRQRRNWVESAVCKISPVDRVVSYTDLWIETGVLDVFAVEYRDEYLLKFFDKKRLSLAQHEASLLTDSIAKSLPTLQFSSVVQIDGYPCHVFQSAGNLRRISGRQLHQENCSFWPDLVIVSPPVELVQRYRRSHPHIWQRVNAEQLERLSWVANDVVQRDMVLSLMQNLHALSDILRALPLVFTNPDAAANLYSVEQGAGRVVAIHWGRWGIEPLGVMLPLLLHDESALQEVLSEASKTRKELVDVSVVDVLLAGQFSILEKSIDKQRWADALYSASMIVQLLDRRNKC